MKGSFYQAILFAIGSVFIIVDGQSTNAGVFYNSYTTYLTGENPYNTDSNFAPQSDSAFGTTSAVLDYTGDGPLGGTFVFSGSAQTAVGALKARAAISLDGYQQRSYALIDAPTFDYLPIAARSQALLTDQVTVSGTDANYDVQFTYRLTGSAMRGEGAESYFRSLVYAQSLFSQVGGFTTIGSATTSFYPDNGPYDSTLLLTAKGIPTNQLLNLTQVLGVILYAADYEYRTDIDPYETGDWSTEHILSQTELVSAPYTLDYHGDFGNTLQLLDVSILDRSGKVASGAMLTSQNGVLYPGQPTGVVPEPSTFVIASFGLIALAVSRLRGRQDGRRVRECCTPPRFLSRHGYS